MTKPPNAVTQYLDQRIAACGRTHAEIAQACGSKPRYIELFRTGAYKVPIDVAGPLATAIGGSPKELFPLVMSQTLPGVWDVILEHYPELQPGHDASNSDCENTIARYLDSHIAASGRTNKDVAIACGFKDAKVIEMLRTGAAKVPIDIACPLAKVVGRDHRELFALMLFEYRPGAWDLVRETCSMLNAGYLNAQAGLDSAHDDTG